MKTFILILSVNCLMPLMLFAQTDWFQKGQDATEPKEQIEFFTKSIEQGNYLSESYYSRASAKLELGDVQGAIDDYTKCIEIDSNDATLYSIRGQTKQYISEDYQGALADMATSGEIYWAYQNSFTNTSTGINVKKENYPCVIACYKKALKRFPNNPSAYGWLGYCYLAMEDDSLALENFSKSISLQPDKTDAFLGLALVCYYKKDKVNAKKHLDQAKALNPLLKQGLKGFELFKKEGFSCNDRDNKALITMLTKWQ